VHAALHGTRPQSGPIAACGDQLRHRSEERELGDLSFEDRWLLTDDCCPECGAALGLESNPDLDLEDPGNKRNWALIGALLAGIPMALALLARMIAVALR